MVKLTIGMPVYNDFKFIEKAITSLLNQSFSDFELVIFDDCSTDGSSELCEKYAEIDSRIKYFRNSQNLGISKNMKRLLEFSQAEYFMWAANDDFWAIGFVKTLIEQLEKDPRLVAAFCTFSQVDETGRVINKRINENYEGDKPINRILKLIKNPSDGFGYGIFRREKIKDVKFPVWSWPNIRCPYNNIYPTLLYYLSLGPYKLINGEPLWFNLIKNDENVNHKIPYTNSFVLCYCAFILRKLNLVWKSFQAVFSCPKMKLTAFIILPRLLYSWFLVPVFLNPKGKYQEFKKGNFNTFI